MTASAASPAFADKAATVDPAMIRAVLWRTCEPATGLPSHPWIP